MRNRLIALTAWLSLALGVAAVLGTAVAQADGPSDWGGPVGPSGTPVVAVYGTIVSADPAQGTFVADAYMPAGDQPDQSQGSSGQSSSSQDSSGQSSSGQSSSSQSSSGQSSSSPDSPSPGGDRSSGDSSTGSSVSSDWLGSGMQPWGATQVTISTGPSTTVQIDGQSSTPASLAQGDRFVALFSGMPGDSLQTLVASPAVAIYAHTPPTDRQLYAFVGSVTAVNPGVGGSGTVSVNVTNTVPGGLVPAGSGPATFTVSAGTVVLGGTAVNGLFGGSLADVHPGDIVAGGVIGSSGETLAQVESSPLQALIDFPAASTGTQTTASVRHARARVLSQALALFGYRGHSTRVRRHRHAAHRRHHAAHRRHHAAHRRHHGHAAHRGHRK